MNVEEPEVVVHVPEVTHASEITVAVEIESGEVESESEYDSLPSE